MVFYDFDTLNVERKLLNLDSESLYYNEFLLQDELSDILIGAGWFGNIFKGLFNIGKRILSPIWSIFKKRGVPIIKKKILPRIVPKIIDIAADKIKKTKWGHTIGKDEIDHATAMAKKQYSNIS
jgi:hypothetical protein